MSNAAFDALKRGDVAVVATDTVYGLAALPGSVGHDEIFALKERPADQVLPWLVADAHSLDVYARDIPIYAHNLVAMFWPGALTLVVRASDAACELSAPALDGTIAVRCPDTPQLLELMDELESPLVCTSANKHGMPAANDLSELNAEMRALPGGDELGSIEGAGNASTIVDCTGAIPKILRRGPISEQLIYDVAFYGATLAR